MNSRSLNIIIKGKYAIPAYISVSLILSFLSYKLSFSPETGERSGILFSSFGVFLEKNIPLSFIINVLCTIGCGLLLLYLDKTFSLIRQHTSLPLFFFLLFSVSNVPQNLHFGNGIVLALLFIVCLFLLYVSYQTSDAPKAAFSISFLLTSCSLFCSSISLYIPLFLLGFYQMRALSLRTVIAFILGIFTPFWIILGSGIVVYSEMHLMKAFSFSFSLPDIHHNILESSIIILTVLLGLFSGISNLYHIYNDKIQTRAYNGFINIISVFTSLFLLIDYQHYGDYWPILAACVSLQASHAFTNIRNKQASIIFYIILTCYLLPYLWNLFRN